MKKERQGEKVMGEEDKREREREREREKNAVCSFFEQ